jgi:integral membrane protein
VLSSSIGRLRLVGLLEGASYVALLFIAMPLKYLNDMPLAVRIAGSVHGALFVLFCFALLHVVVDRGWRLPRAAGVFVASLLPFGTWAIDGRLKRAEHETTPPVAAPRA